VACGLAELFIDIDRGVLNIAVERGREDNALLASMERAPLRRSVIRRFMSSK
jgi:hypothetical protein